MSAWFEAGVHAGLAVVGFLTVMVAVLVVLWVLAVLVTIIADRVTR